MIDKGINMKVHCVMRFINSFIQQMFTDDLLCAITAQDSGESTSTLPFWRLYSNECVLVEGKDNKQ